MSAGNGFEDHFPPTILIFDHESHRQRTGTRRELLQVGLAGHPDEIFFRRQQHQMIGLRLGDEIDRIRRAEAMVIGKTCAVRNLDPRAGQRCKKLFWIGNAGESQHLALADGLDDRPIRLESTAKNGNSAPLGAVDDACRAVRRSDHDQRLGAIELRL